MVLINKKPILYVDLDNVVFDTIGTIKQMYDQNFRYYAGYEWIPAHMVKHYDFSELTFMTPELLTSYFSSGRFFDNVQLQEGADVSLALLNTIADYPLIFVSIGTPQNLAGKEQWVAKFNELWKTDAEFIGVDKCDKPHINFADGILIDDEMKNLENSSAQLTICFGNYEWNKNYEGVRANNWAEIRKIINERK